MAQFSGALGSGEVKVGLRDLKDLSNLFDSMILCLLCGQFRGLGAGHTSPVP